MPEVLHDFLFPATRLDWFGAGPSSPNKTGTLLAILFLACWWPALRFRWGFWISLPLSFLCGVFLIQTESRGALVALFCGLMTILWFRYGARRMRAVRIADILSALSRAKCRNRRKEAQETQRPNSLGSHAFSWRFYRPLRSMSAGGWLRGISLLIFIGVLFAYSMMVGTGQRMAHIASGNDGSANVRVKLYTSGLGMIAASPFGWGHGDASKVYQQWFQTPGDDRTYLSLVNSHLTWMSEYGIFFQLAYISVWIVILSLCLPVPWTPLRITTFSCWFALGVGAVFSSVLTLLWLWLIPVLLLVGCIVQRCLQREWPGATQWRLSALCILLCFFGLHAVARMVPGEPTIACRSGCIHVGDADGGVLLVGLDADVLGEWYGHSIREQLDQVGSITVLVDTNALDRISLDQYDCVALCGDIDELDFLDAYSGMVTLLNPSGGEVFKEMDPAAAYSLRVVIGDMGDWRRSRRWKTITGSNPDWELLVVPGAADYIPDWMSYCAKEEI